MLLSFFSTQTDKILRSTKRQQCTKLELTLNTEITERWSFQAFETIEARQKARCENDV